MKLITLIQNIFPISILFVLYCPNPVPFASAFAWSCDLIVNHEYKQLRELPVHLEQTKAYRNTAVRSSR